MPDLTPKQQRFVEASASTDSATEAARRAGYSPTRANVTASELMAKPHVREAVERRRSEVLAAAGYDPEQSVRRLMAIATDETNYPRDRVRAEELLLKLARMFDDDSEEQYLHLDMSVERLLALEAALMADIEPDP